MRASLITPSLQLAPGRPGSAVVEVTNTTAVIDGVTVSARAGGGLGATSQPALLALFPGSSGRVDIAFTASAHFPAGRHAVVVDIVSSIDPSDRVQLTLALEVLPAPAATIAVDPPTRRARRRVRYRLTATNQGNTNLVVDLAAADPARRLTARVEPPTVSVAPGAEGYAELRVYGRRHFFGAETRHRVSVLARTGELELDTTAAFRQPPVIPVGARTAAVLATIVAVWAAVFIVALQRANSGDALTKQVPPSFYAAVAETHPVNNAAFGVLGRPGVLAAATDGPVPAGAVPKSGVVIGVGGTVDGTVHAASSGAGVGRITVEAFRDSPNGPVLVSSAATATDGTYSLVGLLPGTYKLHFTATGFQDQWYPDAPTEAAATPVYVSSQSDTAGVDVTVSGLPASISGTVDTGQTPAPPVTVTVVSEQGNGQPVATVTTDGSGNYTIPALPAPATYDLSFAAAGYQVASDTEEVAGGEAHIANTIALSAGPGILGGTVTDGTHPLGGVTITANANGQTVTSATPTTGAIGAFTIPGLATPATYLLTFSDPGYGTRTVAEHLDAGQSLTDLSIVLSGGAGQISGQVTGPSGTPLGGVTVTVDGRAGGGSGSTTTNTLTAGSVGSFLLSGLATPGTYTLTFSLAGYQSQTVQVALGSSGSATGVRVELAAEQGTITGTVRSPTGTLSGVTVTVTDGTTVRTTTTTSSPAGGFSLGGLPPASYSVTFSLAGYQSTTVLVHLLAGQTATASATLSPSGPAAP